jgi:hypothetical protein
VNVSRKLAAILVEDIVHYSRVGAEEDRTLARLLGLRGMTAFAWTAVLPVATLVGALRPSETFPVVDIGVGPELIMAISSARC